MYEMIRMISMGEEFKIDIGTKSRGKKLYQSSFWKQERINTLKSKKNMKRIQIKKGRKNCKKRRERTKIEKEKIRKD
jgi:hypothetical protein